MFRAVSGQIVCRYINSKKEREDVREQNKVYQVSTLQALALGYTRAVIRAEDLLKEGDTGLGTFEDVNGEMIVMEGQCYRADQDGINMPGWHLHFLSEDRSKGGHVFDVCLREGTAYVDKISSIAIDLPKEAAFDTYSLKQDLQEEIKSVE